MNTHANHVTARPFVGRIGLWIKGLRLVCHLLLGAGLAPFVPLMGRRSFRLVRWWHGRMLRILNIRLEIDGERPVGPTLIAANHCSWLDIVVLGHAFDAAFISKAEVDGWPLVGAFARASGTLFLARGTGRTRETTEQIQSVLDSGRSALLFPQGTTTRETQPQRFYARLFAAAIEGNYPVLPVAVRYCDDSTPADMHHALAPWVDEAQLWPHFRDLFRLRGMTAQLRLCAPIDSQGYDRRSLAEASRIAISHRQAMAAAQQTRAPAHRPRPRSAA